MDESRFRFPLGMFLPPASPYCEARLFSPTFQRDLILGVDFLAKHPRLGLFSPHSYSFFFPRHAIPEIAALVFSFP